MRLFLNVKSSYRTILPHVISWWFNILLVMVNSMFPRLWPLLFFKILRYMVYAFFVFAADLWWEFDPGIDQSQIKRSDRILDLFRSHLFSSAHRLIGRSETSQNYDTKIMKIFFFLEFMHLLVYCFDHPETLNLTVYPLNVAVVLLCTAWSLCWLRPIINTREVVQVHNNNVRL